MHINCFFVFVLTFRTIYAHNMYSPCSELVVFMYWTGKSMNNLLSYCGLVDAKIRASDRFICKQSLFFPKFWSSRILKNFQSQQLKCEIKKSCRKLKEIFTLILDLKKSLQFVTRDTLLYSLGYPGYLKKKVGIITLISDCLRRPQFVKLYNFLCSLEYLGGLKIN